MFIVRTGILLIDRGSKEREAEEELEKIDIKPISREGDLDSHWILLDFSEILVHVQLAQDRDYYGLERLWKDCPIEVING